MNATIKNDAKSGVLRVRSGSRYAYLGPGEKTKMEILGTLVVKEVAEKKDVEHYADLSKSERLLAQVGEDA